MNLDISFPTADIYRDFETPEMSSVNHNRLFHNVMGLILNDLHNDRETITLSGECPAWIAMTIFGLVKSMYLNVVFQKDQQNLVISSVH